MSSASRTKNTKQDISNLDRLNLTEDETSGLVFALSDSYKEYLVEKQREFEEERSRRKESGVSIHEESDEAEDSDLDSEEASLVIGTKKDDSEDNEGGGDLYDIGVSMNDIEPEASPTYNRASMIDNDLA